MKTLAALINETVFHTHLTNEILVSAVNVIFPIMGGLEHINKIERKVAVSQGQISQNEMAAAISVIGHELSYVLESALIYGFPVVQKNEEGGDTVIGSSMIVLDRSRIKFPEIVCRDGEPYLDFIRR